MICSWVHVSDSSLVWVVANPHVCYSKEIAKKESLRYNEVLLSNTFALSMSASTDNGEIALEHLAVSNTPNIVIPSRIFLGRLRSLN